MADTKICPECGEEYNERPALSRKDGKTQICSSCGIKQALDSVRELYGPGMTDQQWEGYKDGVVQRAKEGYHGQNTL